MLQQPCAKPLLGEERQVERRFGTRTVAAGLLTRKAMETGEVLRQ